VGLADQTATITCTDTAAAVGGAFAAARDGVVVSGVDIRTPDLEAVFLSLTGKALRDGT